MILNNELQIMAEHSVPIVKGREMELVSWYKVTPEKVIVCHYEDCEDKVEEFDICDVELSGLPPGYYDEGSSPTQENPPREIEWRDISKSLEQRLMELSERLGTEKDPQNIVLLVDAIAKLHEVICR